MGTQLLSLLDGLFSVLCFSARLKVRFAFEYFAERVTDKGIVIHDQDGLRHRQTPGDLCQHRSSASSWQGYYLDLCSEGAGISESCSQVASIVKLNPFMTLLARSHFDPEI